MKPKKQPVKPHKKPLGYQGYRDSGTAMTPRQMVDARRAQLLTLTIAEKRGDLVQKSIVEDGMREAAEVIQSDLFGALPSQCASALGNRRQSPDKVRAAVTKIVQAVVKNWESAEIIKP